MPATIRPTNHHGRVTSPARSLHGPVFADEAASDGHRLPPYHDESRAQRDRRDPCGQKSPRRQPASPSLLGCNSPTSLEARRRPDHVSGLFGVEPALRQRVRRWRLEFAAKSAWARLIGAPILSFSWERPIRTEGIGIARNPKAESSPAPGKDLSSDPRRPSIEGSGKSENRNLACIRAARRILAAEDQIGDSERPGAICTKSGSTRPPIGNTPRASGSRRVAVHYEGSGTSRKLRDRPLARRYGNP